MRLRKPVLTNTQNVMDGYGGSRVQEVRKFVEGLPKDPDELLNTRREDPEDDMGEGAADPGVGVASALDGLREIPEGGSLLQPPADQSREVRGDIRVPGEIITLEDSMPDHTVIKAGKGVGIQRRGQKLKGSCRHDAGEFLRAAAGKKMFPDRGGGGIASSGACRVMGVSGPRHREKSQGSALTEDRHGIFQSQEIIGGGEKLPDQRKPGGKSCRGTVQRIFRGGKTRRRKALALFQMYGQGFPVFLRFFLQVRGKLRDGSLVRVLGAAA